MLHEYIIPLLHVRKLEFIDSVHVCSKLYNASSLCTVFITSDGYYCKNDVACHVLREREREGEEEGGMSEKGCILL